MKILKCKQQAGAILIISLIILLVMTIVGIAAMSLVIFEGKMANNIRNHKIAFQEAESALRVAEARLQTEYSEPPVPKNNTCFSGCGDIWILDGFFNNENSYTRDSAWSVEDVRGPGIKTDAERLHDKREEAGNAPLYAIEYLGADRDSMALGHQQDIATNEAKFHYRIIARGYGLDPRARVHLTSDYSRRY